MNSRENSTVARLVCDERTAKCIADSVSESFESSATAAFEGSDGNWSIELHFEHPPDEAEVRLVVSQCAGREAAARLTFETIAARDSPTSSR
jgi:ribosomal protein L11 methyltransferase